MPVFWAAAQFMGKMCAMYREGVVYSMRAARRSTATQWTQWTKWTQWTQWTKWTKWT